MSPMPLSAIQSEYRERLLSKLASGHYQLEEVRSCLCGSTDGTVIASHDRFDVPVGMVLCRACGLARTTPRLAAANLPAFYEHEYHGLHFGLRHPTPDTALFRTGQGVKVLEALFDLLPDRPLRVADVGAGTGQVLREFAAAIGRPIAGVGCEYSQAFVDAGRAAGSDIRHGGPETLGDYAPYDVVILSHVAEHFPDPVPELARLRELGHGRTLYYVEVPGLLTIDEKPEYAYSLEQYVTLAHTFHFTLETLTATMWRAGFGQIRGDEEVVGVWIPSSPADPPLDPAVAERILESLSRLESWPIRARRLRARLRQSIATAAKTILPESVVAAIRSRGSG